MNVFGHLKTISKHRFLVMVHCFKMGLYLQGLTHDLSKYSPWEFIPGCKYYRGYMSPNNAEREDLGFSTAWLHHKGRNRHPFEYWTDLSLEQPGIYAPVRMPRRYVAEMVADRVAASKVYKGDEYDDSCAYVYFNRAPMKGSRIMHEQTAKELGFLLKMVAVKGEDYAFRYIRKVYLRGRYRWLTH